MALCLWSIDGTNSVQGFFSARKSDLHMILHLNIRSTEKIEKPAKLTNNLKRTIPHDIENDNVQIVSNSFLGDHSTIVLIFIKSSL